MTPFPLILLVWGILLASGVLPNRILVWRIPRTVPWRRTRFTLAVAAIATGGFWLALDLVLPLLLPRAHLGARLADIAGWAVFVVAVVICVRLIALRQSFDRPFAADKEMEDWRQR